VVHAVDITLDEARRLIARAIDKAAHIGVRGAFAVVGGSGVLVSASNMDRGGAGGMARARSKAWIAATQQITSTEHHLRMATLPPPIAAGFVACSPEAMFPGAGGMPVYDDGVVIGGFSASGATIGPFVDIPGIDRRMLLVDGKPTNSEDLIVLWTLGLPYRGQHGDDEKRWLEAFGELPSSEAGLGYEDPPPASQPEHEWALGLADRAIAGAARRGVRIAVAVVDVRGEPIQQDTMDGAPTAAPFVAEALAAGAATFQRPSREIDPVLTSVLPYRVLCVPGGLPVSEGDRVVAGVGIAGPDADVCQDIAAAALG
jgi:uncharacterized protein GlcG (DUF336 family)